MFQETVDFTIKLGHWFLITCREVIHLLCEPSYPSIDLPSNETWETAKGVFALLLFLLLLGVLPAYLLFLEPLKLFST